MTEQPITSIHDSVAVRRDELTPGHLELGDEGFAGSVDWKLFVMMILGLLAVGVTSIFGFNAVVDPMGLTGSGRFPLVVVEGASRQAKSERLLGLSEKPGVVLLGSSSARNFDPETVKDLTGKSAFNGSMSAGRPADAFAMTSLTSEKFPSTASTPDGNPASDPDSFPHAVYFIDIDTALAKNPPNAGLVTTSALRKQFDRLETVRMSLETFTPYLQRSTIELSMKSIKRKRAGEEYVEPNAQKELRADGFRRRDPLAGNEGNKKRLAIETERYRRTIYATGNPKYLDHRSTDFVERMLNVALERGGTPTVVIMPVNPLAVDMLEPYGFQERYTAVREYLNELSDGGKIRVLDFGDAEKLGLGPEDYYDNVHTTPEASDKILAAVNEQSALDAP
jgi:hypothetical protein